MATVDRLKIKGKKLVKVEDVVDAVVASPLFAQEEVEAGPEVYAPGVKEKGYWLFFKEKDIVYSVEEAPDFAQRSMLELYGFTHNLEIECRRSTGANWISYLKFNNFLLSEDDGDTVLLANGEDTILERFDGSLKLNRKYFDESEPIEFRKVADRDVAKIFTIPYVIEDLISPFALSEEEIKEMKSRQDPRILNIINRKKNKNKA